MWSRRPTNRCRRVDVSRSRSVDKGATFLLRRPVETMSSLTTRPARSPKGCARHLLEDDGRYRPCGRALRAKLADSVPDRPGEEIETAVQSACQLVLLCEPKAQRGFGVDPISSAIKTVKSDGPGQARRADRRFSTAPSGNRRTGVEGRRADR